MLCGAVPPLSSIPHVGIVSAWAAEKLPVQHTLQHMVQASSEHICWALQEEALDQVKSILGCGTTTARALLIYFSWDTEVVLGKVTDTAGICQASLDLWETPMPF